MTGDCGYRLGPLSSPQPCPGHRPPGVAAAFAGKAVRRAYARLSNFALTDANAPLVADLSATLTAPLAIRFPPPRVSAKKASPRGWTSFPSCGRGAREMPRHR